MAAVVGISGGGPAAVAMAARHRDLVQRLILQSALGPLPWPTGRNRLVAPAVFAPATERATWAAMAAVLRLAPGAGLRLLRDLSTRSVRDVVAGLAAEDRAGLIGLFSRMRSGHGFRNDLRATPDLSAEVGQRCLVIASPERKAVLIRPNPDGTWRVKVSDPGNRLAGHDGWVLLGDGYPSLRPRPRPPASDDPPGTQRPLCRFSPGARP